MVDEFERCLVGLVVADVNGEPLLVVGRVPLVEQVRSRLLPPVDVRSVLLSGDGSVSLSSWAGSDNDAGEKARVPDSDIDASVGATLASNASSARVVSATTTTTFGRVVILSGEGAVGDSKPSRIRPELPVRRAKSG